MALERLLKGFADFRLGYYREHLDLFEKLATEGQSPKILIIGCSDARVDPGILTQTQPGDIFTVRNVAAMVPPAQLPPDERHHGTSSAIEYAVRGLNVEHVVVLPMPATTTSRPGLPSPRRCAIVRCASSKAARVRK